jgi:hypothetical protein
MRAHQDTQEHLHYGVAGQFVQASRGLTRWGGGDDSGGPSDRTGSLLGYPLGVGCRFRWSRLGHSSGRLCLGAIRRSWSDRQKGGNRNKRRPGLLLRQEPLFVKIAQVKQGLARSVPFVSTTRRVGRQILIGNRRGGDEPGRRDRLQDVQHQIAHGPTKVRKHQVPVGGCRSRSRGRRRIHGKNLVQSTSRFHID